MKPEPWDAVIVGGGHNGLVAAFYLSRAGLRVLLLERRQVVGGACVTEEIFPGYRLSTCSFVAWLLQDKVVEDMQLESHGFRWVPMNPWRLSLFPDGSFCRYWADRSRTRQEISNVRKEDGERYPEFNTMWNRATEVLYPFFLREPPSEEEISARAETLGDLPLVAHLQNSSIADVCEEFFDDPRIQAGVVRVGEVGDPWTPGSAWVETYFHLTTTLGQALVIGGMGSITQAMARSAEAAGARIRTDAEVEEILVEDGRVQGVRLASGEVIRSRLVLSNADPKRTYLSLLNPEMLDDTRRQQVMGLSTSTSYMKLHCLVDELPDLSRYLEREAAPEECAYLHIAPSLDTFRRAHQDVMRGVPAQEPVVHIQIPTVYDRSDQAGPLHTASLWVMYAPPQLLTGSWEEQRETVTERLVDYVTEYIPNFRRAIRERVLFTPADLEDRIGLTDGNIRHLDMIPGQFLGGRPFDGAGYGTHVEGLYLCGAGTHPGGEVTGAPGHNAAHVVLRDLA